MAYRPIFSCARSTSSYPESARRMRRPAISAAAMLAVLMIATAGQGATVVDTTRTREPQAPQKSAAARILSARAHVIKLPLKLMRGATRFGMKLAFEKSAPTLSITKVFGTNKPLHPLVSYGSKPSVEGGIGMRLKNLLTEQDQVRAKARWSVNKYQRYLLRYQSGRLLGSQTRFRLRTSYYWKPRY